MAKLKGEFYVDGGYRNNLPVDIALREPITEVIIVDVHEIGNIGCQTELLSYTWLVRGVWEIYYCFIVIVRQKILIWAI